DSALLRDVRVDPSQANRDRDARGSAEEYRMFKSLKVVRLAAGAAAALLGGFAAPAWATYGGGACNRCSPAPVVATQLNVVSLAPQVETVYQTVYETVYETEAVTVMETRYRTAYQTENYTVSRPVWETSFVERKYTVMKPVYQTENRERRYTVQRPVYQTERRERRYTVQRPVYQTVNQERRYTVMKPVTETVMVEQPYTVCRPVTTVRQETVECGYYERQYITVPGPVVERRVRVPVQECDLCGEEQPRGLLGCLHHKRK